MTFSVRENEPIVFDIVSEYGIFHLFFIIALNDSLFTKLV